MHDDVCLCDCGFFQCSTSWLSFFPFFFFISNPLQAPIFKSSDSNEEATAPSYVQPRSVAADVGLYDHRRLLVRHCPTHPNAPSGLATSPPVDKSKRSRLVSSDARR